MAEFPAHAARGRLQAAVAVAALIIIGTGAGTLAGNRDVNGVAVFMLTGWVVAMVALGWVRHSRQAGACLLDDEGRPTTHDRTV